MTKFNEGIAVVNGHFSLISEAKIPLTDRGFLFGHAVFETLLVNHGEIIAWEKHSERLKYSCQRSFIKSPDKNVLKKLSFEAIQKNIELTKSINQKAALRIIITGGNSLELPITKNNEDLPKPNIIIICRNINGPSLEQYKQGVSLKSAPDIRPKQLIDVKSCNYLINIMAIEEARKANYDDVLFYDRNKKFTECTTANFIWFDEDYFVYSAPFKNNCLPGTTLSLLVEALRERKIKFHWKALSKTKLHLIYGAAMLSSTRLILPIKKIDETSLPVRKQEEFFNQLNQALEKKLRP